MFYFMGNDGRYTSPKNLLWTWSNMGVEPREVMESPLLHIFKTWQVPKQQILVIPLSWPPKIYIDLYKVYLTIYMVLCCGALVFWIRKKILGKVYCCVRYQPQYQCVRISVILPVQDMLCSLCLGMPASTKEQLTMLVLPRTVVRMSNVSGQQGECSEESSWLPLSFPYSFCNGRMNETTGLEQCGRMELGNKKLSWQCLWKLLKWKDKWKLGEGMEWH